MDDGRSMGGGGSGRECEKDRVDILTADRGWEMRSRGSWWMGIGRDRVGALVSGSLVRFVFKIVRD